MVGPDRNWSARLTQRLEALSKDRIEADVLLGVGDRQIPAHKFVLDVYCDIMKTDDAYYSVADKLYRVSLSDMSEENYDLLCGIITSLYTGHIEVSEDDAKFVYKFAKIYSVDWLKSKMFAFFENMITEATFIDILKFSYSICCEDLKELCLDYLSPNFLKSLIKTGELVHIDYYCLCTIINNVDSAALPEIKKFQFVCKWFETDVTHRICHLSTLIYLIKFNAIEMADLCSVFEWVVGDTHIDDCLRVSLLKDIKTMSNIPILSTTDERSSNKKLKSCRQIFEKMKKMLLEHPRNSDQSIPPSDYFLIVKKFYSCGDPITKQLIEEFFYKNWEKLVTKDNTTDLVRLNDHEFNLFPFSPINIVHFQSIMRLRESILTIKWDTLSFTNLSKFVEESKSCEVKEKLDIQIVECIMNWALTNVGNGNQIFGLINSSVCLCYIPDEYLNFVLQPYLLTLSIKGEKFSYQCNEHQNQIVFEEGIPVERQPFSGRLLCCCRQLTPKIHMLMRDNLPSYRIYERGQELTPEFLPENEGPLFRLKYSIYTRQRYVEQHVFNPKFILFDKEKCMEQYPVWSNCSLNLNQLREIVVTYKHLSVIFFDENQ